MLQLPARLLTTAVLSKLNNSVLASICKDRVVNGSISEAKNYDIKISVVLRFLFFDWYKDESKNIIVYRCGYVDGDAMCVRFSASG